MVDAIEPETTVTALDTDAWISPGTAVRDGMICSALVGRAMFGITAAITASTGVSGKTADDGIKPPVPGVGQIVGVGAGEGVGEEGGDGGAITGGGAGGGIAAGLLNDH